MTRGEWILMAAVFTAVLAAVWWNLTHKCVESHRELHQQCHSHHVGSQTYTTCRPVEVDVCDEWEER